MGMYACMYVCMYVRRQERRQTQKHMQFDMTLFLFLRRDDADVMTRNTMFLHDVHIRLCLCYASLDIMSLTHIHFCWPRKDKQSNASTANTNIRTCTHIYTCIYLHTPYNIHIYHMHITYMYTHIHMHIPTYTISHTYPSHTYHIHVHTYTHAYTYVHHITYISHTSALPLIISSNNRQLSPTERSRQGEAMHCKRIRRI